ncbi:MAG: hypothetical protein ACPGVT_01310 [Maricaulaceae bacterium]
MKKSTLLLAGSLLAFSGTATAQQQLDEIIVTATKRAESLQEVPIAVSVVTGEELTQ